MTDKKYKNRHFILKTLQKHFEENNRPDSVDTSDIELSFQEIVEKTQLSKTAIIEQIDYLHTKKEIDINEINFNPYYFITQKGTVSYFDKKYLTKGRKEFLNDLFNIVKIISTITLLIIAVISFFINILETKKNKEEIKILKNKIEQSAKPDSKNTLSNTGNNV